MISRRRSIHFMHKESLEQLLKDADIIGVRYYDVTSIDDVTEERLKNETAKPMQVYGKLLNYDPISIKVICEYDEMKEEHYAYLIPIGCIESLCVYVRKTHELGR